jgi:hypothetical protein
MWSNPPIFCLPGAYYFLSFLGLLIRIINHKTEKIFLCAFITFPWLHTQKSQTKNLLNVNSSGKSRIWRALKIGGVSAFIVELDIIHNCIIKNEKYSFICLPQSHNNWIGFINPVLQHEGSTDMREELYIYTEPRGRIHSTQCCCHAGLWRTGSHLSIIISINDDISLLHHPLRKSKLTLFWLLLCL